MRTVDEKIKERRAAILDAAAQLITKVGYEGTSLDAVVKKAGCSKSAIYELFGDKEGVLAALTEDIVAELANTLESFEAEGAGVRETLRQFGKLAVELILEPRHVAIVRATMAVAWKHPRIGKRYYEVGPLRTRKALARYFADQAVTGALEISDPQEAARQFQSLLYMERLIAQMTGARGAPSARVKEHLVNTAVETFLKNRLP